jgi:hypothetical protein
MSAAGEHMAMIRILAALPLLFGLALHPAAAQAPQAEAPAAEAPPPQPVQPQRFRTPEDGFAALARAIRTHDERRLLSVLGEAGRRLISSGNPQADREARLRFVELYDRQHDILRPSPDRAVLQIGAEEWPLPIPMRLRGGSWRFDAREGAQELLDRRIGRNELDVIETLRAIADAQQDYADGAGRQGATRAYAQRFFSRPGQRDGLFWPTAPGEPPAPLGPLVAAASAGDYGGPRRDDTPRPYRGYYFRILTAQGPNAPGGAMDWVVNGRLIGGFAVLAWPATYGGTGWKSFLVNHTGTVWEADLGRDTARTASAIRAFDPGPDWTPVPE